MIINNSTINRAKPQRFLPFKGEPDSGHSEKKLKGKYFRAMDDDMLMLTSVLKAHKDVQNSGKMRLFKSMPEITAILLGATIGLAQPGKLAAKAGAGLGFLALTKLFCSGADLAEKEIKQAKKENSNNTPKAIVKTIGKIALGAGALILGASAIKNTKACKTASAFVQKELTQLAGEINQSKLGKFFEQTVSPFAQKHASKLNTLSAVAPFGIIAASAFGELELADSLSKDIKEKASENYRRGDFIRTQARAHYDSVNAPEVDESFFEKQA